MIFALSCLALVVIWCFLLGLVADYSDVSLSHEFWMAHYVDTRGNVRSVATKRFVSVPHYAKAK